MFFLTAKAKEKCDSGILEDVDGQKESSEGLRGGIEEATERALRQSIREDFLLGGSQVLTILHVHPDELVTWTGSSNCGVS
jgi:hypothetical protein